MIECISGKSKWNQVQDIVQGEYQVILKVKVHPEYLQSGRKKEKLEVNCLHEKLDILVIRRSRMGIPVMSQEGNRLFWMYMYN